jgi:hypothetical protein
MDEAVAMMPYSMQLGCIAWSAGRVGEGVCLSRKLLSSCWFLSFHFPEEVMLTWLL